MVSFVSASFNNDWRRYFYLLPIALLLVIWSISGTIALRHFLLAAIVLTSFSCLNKKVFIDWGQRFFFLLLLTLWFVFHTVFITIEPKWVWSEMVGQWFRAVIICFLGAMVAKSLFDRYGNNAGKCFVGLCLGMGFLYASLVIATVVYYWFHSGHIVTGSFPFTFSARGGKLEVSFVLSIPLALVAVELIQHFLKRETFLGLGLFKIILLVLFLIVAMLLAGARNALIGVVFLALSAVFMWFVSYAKKPKALLILVPVFSLLALFVFFAIKMDARWQIFYDTLPLALDTKGNLAWLTRENYPLMANGERVDVSAYERISWIKVGLELFWSHYPFGYGYGREVFAHALIPVFGGAAAGHSHSGYIDLLVSGGFPALILWLGFVATFVFSVIKTYRHSHSPYALFIFFLLMGFNGRMLLDSVWRDHYLQLHFFIIAALWGILLARDRSNIGDRHENTHYPA